MEFLKSLFTPSEDYSYKIIFLSYLVLSLCCLVLYITAFYWKDIQGFWIVVSRSALCLIVAVSVSPGSSLLRLDVEEAE